MADPHDVPPAWRCAAVVAQQLRHTTKPIHFWFHDRASARYVLEVFAAVAGGEREAARFPFAYAFLEPISPLRFPRNGVDLLYETARMDLPVALGPMAQTGASAPGTLAGTLVQEHAELLAAVCVVQMVKPGLPVMYGGIPHAFDMCTTQMIFAGPEQALMAVAMTQMGKRLGLPVYINVGLTDSKCVDAQAGIEAGITLAMGVAAGADIFGHLGICGVDQATSLDMLVMQNEVVGYVERLQRGIELSDETLGLDVIREVGPGGTYLGHEHTARHFRRELWFPGLLDRQYYEAWNTAGRSAMAERCRAEKERIFATHRPDPLPVEVEREVSRILDSAKRALG
jgi:trimethylamine--corrinoid protein Co-methyltransferase